MSKLLTSVERICAVLLAFGLLSLAGPALGQGAPFGGSIGLTLTPSTTTPLPGSNFTVDLSIDLSAATGTCTGPSTVPMTLGSYGLGVTYDNTKLQYVSVASCGAAQFTNPVCNDSGTTVNCNDTNTGNTAQPQGNVCVSRMTFRYIATTGSATLATVHTPAPRGIASNLVAGCGGPATFPSANVNDATSSAMTPSTPSAGSNTPVCQGGTLNLTTPTITGATYAWTGPNGFTSAVQNPVVSGVSLLAAGTYNVTTTVNGVTSLPGSTSVTVNALPATPTAGSNSPVCAGGSINLTTPTVGSATYAWTGPNGYTSTAQNPTIASATTAMTGTYNVAITVNGCTSAAGSTSVTVNAIPSTPTAGSNSPVCAGGSINLTTPTVGSATYAWTGPNGYTSSAQNPTIASATTAMTGTYNVTVAVNGCTSPAGSTSVTVNSVPGTPTAGSNSPICAGATLNLTTPTVPSATYLWTGPNSFVSATQNPSIANATTADTGVYSVTVTVSGCASLAGSTSATVNADTAAPVVTAPAPVTVDQTICCGTFGGATPAGSPALNTFIGGGSATDDCTASPTRLAAQLNGSDIASGTCFESGANSVTFRYQDAAGHTGTATATATVRMFADLNADNVIDPSDMVILRAYFNFALVPGTPPFNAPLNMADLDHNADVGPTDFVIMRAYFNFVIFCLAP